MVIWKLEGNEVGPEGNGAYYFANREEAISYKRAHKLWLKENGRSTTIYGPEKMIIRNREDMVDALNAAMGYGAT